MATTTRKKLYTLTEVAKETGISLPTLRRYKKEYQNRIPSRGTGRAQRYPKEALRVFQELKKENIERRGRPRRSAGIAGMAKGFRKPAAAGAPRRHIAKPATASEIMEATGLRQADLKEMRKLLNNLGSYERLAKYRLLR